MIVLDADNYDSELNECVFCGKDVVVFKEENICIEGVTTNLPIKLREKESLFGLLPAHMFHYHSACAESGLIKRICELAEKYYAVIEKEVALIEYNALKANRSIYVHPIGFLRERHPAEYAELKEELKVIRKQLNG